MAKIRQVDAAREYCTSDTTLRKLVLSGLLTPIGGLGGRGGEVWYAREDLDRVAEEIPRSRRNLKAWFEKCGGILVDEPPPSPAPPRPADDMPVEVSGWLYRGQMYESKREAFLAWVESVC